MRPVAPRVKLAWRPLNVRIIGRNLPGLRWEARDAVHVGIQRGTDVVDCVPGDADAATFSFSVDVAARAADELDFRGPFVHGRRGERFLYLSWGEFDSGGQFGMFRRAKLHLSALERQDIEHALATGAVVEASLDLTDAYGGPVCASVRPPKVRWQIAESGHAESAGT